MAGPLHGIRVIDTSTGPVGGVATMVLADFGADVVKVEPPGGDRFRTMPASPLWLRGKRSVVLDLHGSDGRDRLAALVCDADVLVVSGPPGRAARWGLDARALALLQPRLVHCSITGWGEVGPLAQVPGYVAAVAARGGRMAAFTGQVRRDGPVYAAVPVAAHVAAHGAVQGIVSALMVRDQHDGPQHVTTSLLQGLLPFDLVELLLVQLGQRTGTMPARPTAADLPTLNYHPVRSADGVWIQCGNLLEHLFLSFLGAIDLYGELLGDPEGRFLESPALWTPEAIEHARDRILETMLQKTADEWMTIFHADGNVAAEPFASAAQALDHPDLVANGAVVEVVDRTVGPVRMIGAVATLSDTPAVIGRGAPTVGEHTDEVLAEQPRPSSSPLSSRPRSARRGRPLDGVVVAEFASVIAAPLGASMLADLGARVIRVEPIEGDSFRALLPNGLMTVKTTAGKESINVDLKRAEGRDIARRIIGGADVLIHNYRPGVPERLGIGYDELHAAHPTLVWVAVNGYGPHGPSARRPATHPVAGASMGGAAYQAGSALTQPCASLAEVREIARQLMRANEPSPDPNTSVIVASATVLALLARERWGSGQAVHVDMLTANAHANADAFLSYAGMASRPEVDDDHLGTGPWHRLYRARSGWVFLAVTTPVERSRFCSVTGFDDPGDAPSVAALEALFASRDGAAWESDLCAAGVACVVADESTPGYFALEHPQMAANGFAPVSTHARFGDIHRWGPVVMVDGGMSTYGPGVLGGEHTDALLSELGHHPDSIARLRAAGTVASEPV